ncbi:MAG: hypothetical protein HY736_08265 [Verrucomicrobia bacterium]|nr:hypothetical protein [Verrucomicrobiota bacterium]
MFLPLGASLVPLSAQRAASPPGAVIEIGSRRELFVDGFLVDQLKGKAQLRMHQPVAREAVMVHDAPWEGSATAYHSIFQDGNRYRMYYRAWQITVTAKKVTTDDHSTFLCYAESDDGIRWRRPELGLHEFKGSTANNIVIASGKVEGVNVETNIPAVFKDENPNAASDARYKAFLGSKSPRGLLAFKSPDGIHWAPMRNVPVITDGAFDSQNLAFWDGGRGEYRAYWRYFSRGTADSPYIGVRAIRTATSKDFLHWENQADLSYVDSPPEHLYTNQIKPYHRAVHLLVGFPVRYIEPELGHPAAIDAREPVGPERTRRWSTSMRALPELGPREMRAGASERYGTALTETLIMASRDGVTFKRWNEGFLRPGPEREGTWNYGHLFAAWHIVETRSALEGAPNELSLYATESYWTGHSSILRRFTLRLDGFVSVRAPMSGGELVTKPVRFQGKSLCLNFSTSAAGGVRVEIQDVNGRPLPGFALEDCAPIFGDTIERAVTWTKGQDVRSLAGQPVRLRFVLKDADVYAFQFKE